MASFSSSTPSPSSSLSSQHAYIPLPAQWKVLIREHQESQVELPPCPVKAIKRIEAIGNHLLSPLFFFSFWNSSQEILLIVATGVITPQTINERLWRKKLDGGLHLLLLLLHLYRPRLLSARQSSCPATFFLGGFWKILARAALGLEQFPVGFCVQSTRNRPSSSLCESQANLSIRPLQAALKPAHSSHWLEN